MGTARTIVAHHVVSQLEEALRERQPQSLGAARDRHLQVPKAQPWL